MAKYLVLFFVSCWHILAYANDECVNAATLTPGLTCSNTYGSFSGATISSAAPACGASASQDLWYKFTATDVTMSINLTSESGLNHGFEIIQGSCAGTVLYCVNNNGTGIGEGYFNNDFIPGQQYYIRVFNASATLSSITFGICIRKFPTPANDLCAGASEILPNATCTNTYGSFSGALLDGNTSACAPSSSQDIWYKFTATDSTMSISLTSESGLNHGFEIIQGGCNGTVLYCVNNNSTGISEGYFNNDFIPGQVYYVRVFNTSASLSTTTFGICIRKFPKPVNDDCANATGVLPNAACTNIYGSFSGSMLDGGTPACATSTSQDIWYKFIATDTTMSISLTSESGLNHGFEIVQGGCNGTVLDCINNNSAGISEGYFNNDFVPGQMYYVRVFNASASLSTTTFGICIRKFPKPVNDDCATAADIIPNATCTYTYGSFSGSMMDGNTSACATSASQDIWYKFTATDVTMSISLSSESGLNHGFEIIQGGCNGTVLYCVNNNSAGISEGYFNNDFIPGQVYYVRVFNASSSLSTITFGICIRKFPNPSNDGCATASEIVPTASCTYTYGSFSGAMLNGGIPSCGTSASQDIWYKFTATDKTMSINLSSESGLNHGFEIIQGGCNGTVLYCVNNNASGISEGYFNNDFIPGQIYYVRVFNASASLNAITFGICIVKYPSPANDVCANAAQLVPAATCSNIYGTFSGAMQDGNIAACAPAASQDVWYKFIATSSNIAIQLGSLSGVNHGFQLFEGGCNGTQIFCTNQNGTGSGEYSTWSALTVGQTYHIRVFNTSTSLSTGTFSICLTGTAPGSCTPSVEISTASTSFCTGESVVFTANPTYGGTSPFYQWKVNGSNAGTNNPVFTTSALTNGSTVSVVMVGNATCSPAVTVTSNVITMNASATATVPLFSQIPAICSGGSFSLPATSSNGISGTWSPAMNNTATTTYTFTPALGQCASAATMTVTVNNNTTPAFTQVPVICSGGSFTLPSTSNNGISGTWSPAVNNSVTTTYIFTPNAGQCALPATMTVTVNNGTVPAFNQIQAICSGGTITLPATSTNGISGSWSPAVDNTTMKMYTFTPNAGQCAASTAMTVIVNSNLTPTFSQIPPICSGGTFTLPTVSNNGISGTWSPAVNNFSTATYTFTPSAGQCAVPTTMTVIVNSTSTVPAFTQVQPICTGGTFTLPTISNNGISGVWSPAINNTATTTYTFTPNAGQCASATATMTVTVNNSSVTPTFTQIAAICSGASLMLPLTSTNGISGSWSPAANNTATTTYTFTPNAGQCASTAAMTVTVNSSTTPTFTQVAAICSGGSFSLPTTSSNGINGTWSPAVNNTATATYTFTPAAGQCASTATMTVTVNSSTTPAFMQIAAICSGGSFTLPTTSSNGINGTWSPAVNNTATTTYTFTPTAGQCASTTTMTVTVNNNTTPAFAQIAPICTGGSFTLPTTSSNGISGTWSPAVNNTATTTYTFTPTAGQCASTATMTVTVNSTTATPTFTQIANICSGTSLTLPTVSNNGISGTWSPAVNNTATTMYTFAPNAGQCASTTTMTVTVNSNTTPAFTQIAPICSGGSFTLPTTSNNGINGTWSPVVNNTATTTYTFTPTAGQCASTTTMTVTVNSASTVPSFTQIADICSGESFVLPTTSNNGIGGTWNPAINNTATTTYTFTPNAGQCAAAATMTVTVNSSTIPTFIQVPAICEGDPFILPVISNNAIMGTWSPAINNTATTTYTFTPEPGFGECIQTATMTVVVNSVNAGITVQGNTLTASASGATYQWINCANNQPVSGATNASFTPTQNGAYAVTVTQNGCSETSGCITINTLGVETLEQNAWKVYPNPASYQLFIELYEATEIVMLNLTGKIVLLESLKAGNNAIDVSTLTPGVYFIRSTSGAIVKFVKQ